MQGFNVCHRDLKPQNIFIKDSSLKIGDLGSSRSLSYKALRDDFSITGTPLYLSPALRLAYARSLNGGSSNVNHNPFKSDVFSLGLVLLYMASLEEVNSLAVVEGLQREIDRRLEIIRENYPVVFELIRNMLVIEEDQRVDFLECFKILEKFFVFCEFCREKKVFNECLKKVDRFYCKECLQAVNLFEVDKL
jgi:serine/threonine protein kinase